ncbi:MAG: adenylate cyclase, partial [Pseudonocardiales bacterium]|nr:adenylate cyclase [Pseudonocardiales bacterium]
MRLRRPRSDAADVSGDEPQQKVLSERIAKLIDTSPAVRAVALEVGMVDPQWLAAPSHHKPAVAPPFEMLRRFVERTADQHPSVLSTLGVNAVQFLSWDLLWGRRPLQNREKIGTATVVFTDLEGFTHYTATFGDEAALALIDEHYRAT